jgi:hypothetical protein
MTEPQSVEATVTIASHTIELALTGQPDVPYKWGPGSLRPAFITFTYRPNGIHAHLYGVWVRGTGEVSDDPCDQAYRIGDPDEWPGWMTELAREHDPRTAPAVQASATDRAALRDRLAAAVSGAVWAPPGSELVRTATAAVLAVLPATADRAAVRAEAFREAAVAVRRGAFADTFDRMAAAELRRTADETQQPETQALAPMLEGLHRLLATSSRDWGQYAPDAWLWAVLCGWDCEEGHAHDGDCDGAMAEIAAKHGWGDDTVAKARRYRAAVRALTEPAAVRQPKEA